MSIKPAPIVVQPTGNFSGNDGSWSTFGVAAGTPPQLLELLVSSQVPETWVVLDEGCTSEDPKNCTITRGGTYNYGDSTTWDHKNNYALGAEANLDYPTTAGTNTSDNGAYGFETIGLRTTAGSNVTADKSVIAGIATKDFYLGSLGLAARDITFGSSGDTAPSLIKNLKTNNLISNQGYGYTAGASYRNATGSLTIGGYDASRLIPNDVTFSFNNAIVRQLLVAIQGITVTDPDTETAVLPQSILALVDSTIPHIWLPTAVCQSFEDIFGMTWDPIRNLYLINDTQHDAMLKQNATISFQLANSLNGGSAVNITLPYASFDLEVESPSPRRYFPLKQAKSETQYTLGRTFLQEAFMVVDYDNNNFSISQAQYNEGTPAHIVALTMSGTTDSTNTNTTSENPPLVKTTSHSSGGIGTGAIAGIVVVVVLILLGSGFLAWRKCTGRKRQTKSFEVDGELDAEPKEGFFGKTRVSSESQDETKKGPRVMQKEVVATPPAELNGSNVFELSSNQSFPAEMPSPDPELEAASINRSELSTPEPIGSPSELSTGGQYAFPKLSGSRRSSRFRNRSLDSDISTLPGNASPTSGQHDRQNSQDSIANPMIARGSSLRSSQQRQSVRRPSLRRHGNSASSDTTFQTRMDEPGFSPPRPSSPFKSQASPSMSAFSSPTLPNHDPGLLTPHFETESAQLMNPPPPEARKTMFTEHVSPEPEPVDREKDASGKIVVKKEVERLEERYRRSN